MFIRWMDKTIQKFLASLDLPSIGNDQNEKLLPEISQRKFIR